MTVDEAQAAAVALIDSWSTRTEKRWARVCKHLANVAAERLPTLVTIVAAGSDNDWNKPHPDELLPPDASAEYARDATQSNRAAYAHEVAGSFSPTAAALGVAYTVRNPLVEGVIAKHSGRNVTYITDTIRAELARSLEDSHEKGLSVPHAAAALRAKGLEMSVGRANVIARTELNSINNGASHAAVTTVNGAALNMGLDPIASFKNWLATSDARTRADHAHANGQQVKMNELFSVGGYAMAYPGDPDGPAREVVNCRCTLTYSETATALTAHGGTTVTTPITAAVEDDTEATSDGAAWSALLTQEDADTGDGRRIAKDALGWRTLPLSLMGMTETAGGHDGATVAGRIDAIEKASGDVNGIGVFATTQSAMEIEGLVKGGFLTGVSVDLAVDEWTLEPPEGYEDDENYEPFWDDIFVVQKGTILGATVCPFPAFAEAKIVVASIPAPGVPFVITLTRQLKMTTPKGPVTAAVADPVALEVEAIVENPGNLTGVTASAAGLAVDRPPLDWFQHSEPDKPTPITITEDGHIFGHAALWGTCHIGLPGCTTPPENPSGMYSWFHLGEVETDGGLVSVGTITLATGHADLKANARKALEHYDHTGTQAAYVRASNGKYGIWVSGSIKPDLDTGTLAELRAAKLSGDWRPVAGNLEMVGLLAVNVPGFPVPREEALMASASDGTPRVLALVAAGIPNETRARQAQEAFSSVTRDESAVALRLARMALYSAAGLREETLASIRDAARA